MKARVMRHVFIAILTMVFLTSILGGNLFAKTFRLTIGAGFPIPTIWVSPIHDFFEREVKKRVEATTNHKIQWVEAYAGSIAKGGEVLEAVEQGLLDIGGTTACFEPTKLFIHNYAYFVPFGSPDKRLVSGVNLRVYDKVPFLKNVFEQKYNQKWLGTFTYPSYELITKFPWKQVEDLKNRKICAAGPNLPWIASIGAVPVQGTLAEAYTSLQTGVYEGWVMFIDGSVGFKLYEAAKYQANVGFGCISGGAITINLDIWKSLPNEIQKIMIDVGREYTDEDDRVTIARTKVGIEKMKKSGVTFYDVPDNIREKWASMLPELPYLKAKEAEEMGMPGFKVIKTYIQELESAGYKFPRKWKLE